MKKFAKVIIILTIVSTLLVSVGLLSACNKNSEKTITVCASDVPHAEILDGVVKNLMKEKGYDREHLRTEHLDQEKMEYLYTGKEGGKSHNYGLNFSDMDFLREFTGLSYQVMFTGVE